MGMPKRSYNIKHRENPHPPEKTMGKLFGVLILAILLAGAAFADVLILKDGSIIRGKFVGYENGKFIFETGGNRLEYRPDQVTRLIVETETYASSDSNNPRPSLSRRMETELTPFDVKLEDHYFRSEIQVERGQRVRVEASGTIYLDGRISTGPDGLKGKRDHEAPMPQENDGALIAAIGQDVNSPSIFIGRSREFRADTDGTLYFTVNHGEPRGASGAFHVTVSIDRGAGGGEDNGNRASSGSSPPPQGQGHEKIITVNGNQQWTDTGINVEPNMTFTITAEGSIQIDSQNRSNPDGNRAANIGSLTYPMNEVGVGALIGKIHYRDGGDSNLIFIGSHGEATSEPNERGSLFLGINDEYFRDNSGSYRVTVRW